MPISFLKKIKNPESSISSYKKITPSDIVDDFIEGFYVFSCKALNSKQLLFNDGFPVMIFMPHEHPPIKVTVGGTVTLMESMWMCGGVLKNVYIDPLDKVDHMLIVRFKPASFYKMFDLSPLIFQKRPVCNLREVLNGKHASFVDGVRAYPIARDRVRFIESYLKDLRHDHECPSLLNEAMEFINVEKGKVSVQGVLRRFGENINYKWLERTFLSHIGMPPKKYILLQRFLHAYTDLTENPTYDLIEIADKHGYYDQYHFLKDFKRYVGSSPSIYLNGT